jgi:DNA-binding beta-propeller fold protein YncE
MDSPLGRVYVVDPPFGHLYMADATTYSLIGQPLYLGSIYRGAVNPSAHLIYTTDIGGDLQIVDGNTNTLVDTIHFGGELTEIAYNPTSNRIFVVEQTHFVLKVLDAADYSVITDIPMPRQWNANDIAINAFTNQIYLSLPDGDYTGDILQIDGYTNTIADTVHVPSSTYTVDVNPAINHVYAAGSGKSIPSGKLYVIDGNTYKVVSSTFVGSFPYDLASDAVTSGIYVVTFEDSLASADTQQASALTYFAANRTLESVIASVQSPPAQGNALLRLQDIRPVRNAPERNYFVTKTVTLTWSRVSWASGYKVEVSRNAGFTDIHFQRSDLGANDLSVDTTELDNRVYYWRVAAKKADGNWGTWSKIDRFEVKVLP